MEGPADPNSIEILITLPLQDDLIAPLRELSPRLNFTIQPARRPEDILAEVWAKTEVLYTDRVLPSPEQAPNLRWLQFHSAGIDFAVDSPILQKPGLAATTLSGAAVPQSAEYCLAVLLSMTHHLPELLTAQTKAEWPHDRWENFIPKELRGSTIGIVGYGSIGRELARLLLPFGATVLAAKHDAMRPVDIGYTAEGLGDPEGNLFTRLYPYQAVGSMVKLCDFVVIAVPLTPVTKGMYGAQEIAAMKPGSYLIVVGRGGVVDETALLSALQEKRLAGAALDVFSEEPLSPTNPLWRAPGILITPHIAGISTQYDRRAMDLFAANLKRYLGNSPLYNLYNPQKGY
jgi:phosphoglycerate dehydrogenase-like enzyme